MYVCVLFFFLSFFFFFFLSHSHSLILCRLSLCQSFFFPLFYLTFLLVINLSFTQHTQYLNCFQLQPTKGINHSTYNNIWSSAFVLCLNILTKNLCSFYILCIQFPFLVFLFQFLFNLFLKPIHSLCFSSSLSSIQQSWFVFLQMVMVRLEPIGFESLPTFIRNTHSIRATHCGLTLNVNFQFRFRTRASTREPH